MNDRLARISLNFVRVCWATVAIVAVGAITFAIVGGIFS